MKTIAPLLALSLTACAATPASPTAGRTVLTGARVNGVATDLWVEGGRFVADDGAGPAAGDRVVALDGAWVLPAFIDSHVHLTFRPRAEALAAGGIAAGVDLAAPRASLGAESGPVRLLGSGPMITAPGGYPTQSWGSDGYGWVVASADEAVEAVHALADEGAGVIKVPLAHGPRLPDETLRAIVEAAHGRGLRVAAHAMGAEDARQAAEAGADLLAHTPAEPLPADVVALWSGRAVVSTLRAFGASSSAVANLGALHEAGCRVLYGTDYGNSAVDGIDPAEMALLEVAGLTPDEALAAATTAPAAYWGWGDLGSLQPGAAASFVVVDGDPRQDWAVLGAPRQVWIDGAAR